MRKYLIIGLVLMLSTVLAAPASADRPFEFPDTIGPFPDINPCSGELMFVTIDVAVKLHLHQNNVVATVKRSGTTSDGFEMFNGTESFQENGHVVRGAFTDMWRNDAGDRFRASGKFVFNANTGTSQVDDFILTCVG